MSDECNDKRQVAPALAGLDGLPAVLGKPVGLLADTGYFSRANVERCEAAGLTPYIATGREGHNLPLAERHARPPPCPPDADAATRMAHRLKTPEGRALYARRKSTVEDGVRDRQGGDGVSALSSARSGGGAWRMDADLPGVEPETDACLELRGKDRFFTPRRGRSRRFVADRACIGVAKRSR